MGSLGATSVQANCVSVPTRLFPTDKPANWSFLRSSSFTSAPCRLGVLLRAELHPRRSIVDQRAWCSDGLSKRGIGSRVKNHTMGVTRFSLCHLWLSLSATLNSLGIQRYTSSKSPAMEMQARSRVSLARPFLPLRLSLLLRVVLHRRKPFRRLHGDGSSTAPHRASVQATPVQDLVRREDSEYLVGFKEKILLSSEFCETVGSEGPARVHIDLALKRASFYKRFIWRLVSLGMVRLRKRMEPND